MADRSEGHADSAARRAADDAAAAAPRRQRIGPSAADFGLPVAPQCPFCDGAQTELHAPFGPQLSVATYWCRACHTAFEWIKWSP